jgi:Tol biopolymer transport system component
LCFKAIPIAIGRRHTLKEVVRRVPINNGGISQDFYRVRQLVRNRHHEVVPLSSWIHLVKDAIGPGLGDRQQQAREDLSSTLSQVHVHDAIGTVDGGHTLQERRGAFRRELDGLADDRAGAPHPGEWLSLPIRVEPGGAVQFSVGEDGTLVYLRGKTPGNRLAWIDRAGKEERLDMASRSVIYPRLSPDGTRVALNVQGQENGIWIWHLGRKTFTGLTFDPAFQNVWWTPDGQRLVFSSQHENVHALYWQAAEGTGAVERIATSTTPIDPGSVSPDGRWLVSATVTSATGRDIVAVDLGNTDGLRARVSGEPSDSTRELRPLVQTKFNERNPEISPDGRWVAYDSDESGSFEVYVRPFPDVNAGRWQISERGGVHPRWGRNGRELFYVAPDGWAMSVPMQPGAGSAFGGATRVADLSSSYNPRGGRMYDVSLDGTRILALRDADETGRAEIHVVLNWLEELKQRVPTR